MINFKLNYLALSHLGELSEKMDGIKKKGRSATAPTVVAAVASQSLEVRLMNVSVPGGVDHLRNLFSVVWRQQTSCTIRLRSAALWARACVRGCAM